MGSNPLLYDRLVLRPRFGFEPDLVVYGMAQLLFASQVPFGGLNRDMPQQKLNLFKFAAGEIEQASTRATQIVGRGLLDFSSPRRLPKIACDMDFA